MSFFTHYWRRDTWDLSKGEELDHTAGNLFRARGVKQGDFIYVITSEEGHLRLMGRMQVAKIVGQTEAEKDFGQSLWQADDHCIATPESTRVLREDIVVPDDVTRALRFQTNGTVEAPVFRHGRLDRQTLRGVRQLTPASAKMLDEFLADGPPSGKRNPPWTRDELILALDLYKRVNPLHTSEKNPEIIALSDLLNTLPLRLEAGQPHKFRNPNGVYMKLCNFLRLDPSYPGAGLRAGGKLEEDIWKEFANDERRLRETVAAIRANAPSVAASSTEDGPFFDPDFEASEGRILTRVHLARERNRTLVVRKKMQVKRETGRLACEVCDFDFLSRYGALGDGFAECHHDVPVSALRPGTKTKLTDLRILCANCHRMVHRQRPWLTIEELGGIVRRTR